MKDIEAADHTELANSPLYEKLYRIPAIYYGEWLKRFGGTFDGKCVLDFGCGEGVVSLGLSRFCKVESVLGVDIGTDFTKLQDHLHAHDLSPGAALNKVTFKQIKPCESLGSAQFDVVVSWSVLEHVSQDIFDEQIAVLVDALKPGGYALIQVAPLYFSPFGSHLFGHHQPWGHLTEQTNLLKESLYKACGERTDVAENHWNCFVTLNKFTAEEFTSRLENSGLKILSIYETNTDHPPHKKLLSTFQKDILVKEQIFLVCQKQ